MLFEWDAAKSAKLKAERGASFDQWEEAIVGGHLLAVKEHSHHADQEVLVIRLNGVIWAVISERRNGKTRWVTAYPSRKWRKKYDN